MSLLHFSNQRVRYGVVIDVGSGSVLVSVVQSDPSLTAPIILWSHREYTPLRDIDITEQSAKAVMTSLVNATMLLDTEGRKALRNHNPRAKITELQCSVCAPWSYTVTKDVNYKKDKPFRIRRELIEDLERTIDEEIARELQENKVLKELGLVVMSQLTSGLLANGYSVENPIDQETMTIQLSRTSSVSQAYLFNALSEVRNKLFPGVNNVRNISFILLFYSVLRDSVSTLNDACLVNITYEATEIGIIREKVLHYATHMPYGIMTLARAIAHSVKVPLSEAMAYLQEQPPFVFQKKLSQAKKDEVDKIFATYVEHLSDLLVETGDNLLVPTNFYLQDNNHSNALLSVLLSRAMEKVSDQQLTVIPASAILRTKEKNVKINSEGDSALAISAQFFHNQTSQRRFIFN